MNAWASPLDALIEARLGLVPRAPRASTLVAETPRATPPSAQLLAGAPIDGETWQSLISTITVGETRFFRDRRWFEAVIGRALTPLIGRRRQEGRRKLAIWSAGCSTGEEAYTLALALREMLPDFADWSISIAATDIRNAAIAFAREGVYARHQLRELEAPAIARYFEDAAGGRMRVGEDLRAVVEFGFTNLADPSTYPIGAAFGGFDLVLCRNVLMYMTDAAQRAVCGRLIAALSEDGWLVTSPAESSSALFEPLVAVNLPDAILFHRADDEVDAPISTGRSPHATQIATPVSTPVAVTAPKRHVAPDEPALSLADIRALADRGRLDAARAACAAWLARNGESAEIYLIQCQIAFECGDVAGAREASHRAVYLAPRSAAAHFLMATAWRRLGKTERARRAMRAAADLAREDGPDATAGDAGGISARYIRTAAREFLNHPGGVDG